MVKNILFVDDSKLEYDLFIVAAELIGFKGKMQCINDPRRLFHELHQNDDLPDVIMIDIRMPYINGHHLTRKIKSHPKYNNIYVVMFTSSDLNSDRQTAFESGANYFFNKPEKFKDYPGIVSKMLILANENRAGLS